MATISLRHIEKIYPNEDGGKKAKKLGLEVDARGVLAVQDFNLEIADKEFIVFVGPSGCGKSTTLRMIAGLEEITDGELYIDNELMNDVEPKDRDIAMVFQSYALYPHMSVRDNMAFPLKMSKLSKEEINEKVLEAAEILNITEFLDRKPKALSGGQKQRVAIGRAIVRNPKALLMDEPLSNLDAKLRNQMRSEIIKLREKIQTTFIYVTHDQTEAMTLGDRIVVMKLGLIQQIGTPQELYRNPINLFVAGFIGTPQMNFEKGELIKEGQKYFVLVHGAKIELSEEKANNLLKQGVESRSIIVGMRPQHVRIAKEGEPYFTGRIDISEMMGSETYLHLNVDGSDIVSVITETKENRDFGFEKGKDLKLTCDGALINIFNPDTERNLEFENK